MYKKLFILFALFLIVFSVNTVSAKEQSDYMRFRFGIGGFISTSNLLGLIETVKMSEAIKNDTDYEYPGLTDEQKEAFNELDAGMRRAILVANILGGMEYGLQTRITWKPLIVEADIVLLPFDGSYNGKLDFAVTAMIGARVPFFIMPYIMAGPTFTFSFYPERFATVENWRGNWAATDHFVFRPGLNSRLGLDLDFGHLAIGGYFQWTVKDFQEFGSWYWHLAQEFGNAEAVGRIFAAQCRFGAILTYYF
ncbi:MAG: hypothetical protein JXB50_10425 [Spirochaetes bacterium]|nr:hypothetical protein [Spirochaetota bacterium]